MKEYEAILEIINQCPLNRDGDTWFEEIEDRRSGRVCEEKIRRTGNYL